MNPRNKFLSERINKRSLLLFFAIMMILSGLYYGSCKKEDRNTLATISLVNLKVGAMVDTLTISGTGFASPSQLSGTFSGANLTILPSSASSTNITATVPHLASTVGSLALKQNQTTLSFSFTLEISGLTVAPPMDGKPSSIMIKGAGFSSALINNSVLIGSFSYKIIDVNEAGTQLNALANNTNLNPPYTLTLGQATQSISIPFPLSNFTIGPDNGEPGYSVSIIGTGFSTDLSQDSVRFNGVNAEILSATPTKLIVKVPDQATTGPVLVQVGKLRLFGPSFNFRGITTLISPSLSVDSGITGDLVVIQGKGFSSLDVQNSVLFGNIPAIVTQASAVSLNVIVPPLVATGPIKITVGTQSIVGPIFKVIPLTINSLSQDSVPIGTTLTITGTGFSKSKSRNQVSFNGIDAPIISLFPSGNDPIAIFPKQMVVKVPPGATTGAISVSVNGIAITGPKLTVTALTLDGISPSSGTIGTQITLTGNGFSRVLYENQVAFKTLSGIVYGQVVSASPNSLIVKVPGAGISGPITLTVKNIEAVGNPIFTYNLATISGISPINGVEGSTVTITGTGFSNNILDNMISFSGANKAPLSAIVTSASLNQIIVKVPYGGFTGPISIQIGNQNLTSTSFTYSNPSNAQVSTYAGHISFDGIFGVSGLKNGPLLNSGFIIPQSLTIDPSGNIFVIEFDEYYGLSYIRKISKDGQVSTLPSISLLNPDIYPTPQLVGICSDPSGNIFFSDLANYAIFELTPDGIYHIIAGGDPNLAGTPQNGTGKRAGFASPTGLISDSQGNIYVADRDANLIRKIVPAAGGGPAKVSTFVGDGSAANLDGTGLGAELNAPFAFTIDASDNIYVGEYNDGAIRKISPLRNVSTIATFPLDYFSGGIIPALAINPSGTLFVSDATTSAIYKVSPTGQISTIAGLFGSAGYLDGNASKALFTSPGGILLLNSNTLIVADAGNFLIRKITGF